MTSTSSGGGSESPHESLHKLDQSALCRMSVCGWLLYRNQEEHVMKMSNASVLNFNICEPYGIYNKQIQVTKRVKQLCSVGAAAVGKALESLVQVLLKSVSSQQWGALIQTSTLQYYSCSAGLTWSSTSVFWLLILPEERIQSAPLYYAFKKPKRPRHLSNFPFY